MAKIKTYKLNIWLPAIVASLSICLFLVQSIEHYQENIAHVYETNEHNLKQTAWRLSRTLEYTLTQNDISEAKRELSLFALGDHVDFSVLVSPELNIELASSFAWQGQAIEQVLPHIYDELKHYQTLGSDHITHSHGHQITAIVPVKTASSSKIRNYTPKLLVLQIDLTTQLKQVFNTTVAQAQHSLLLILVFTLFLIFIIKRMVFIPLQALNTLCQQLTDNKPLTNPLMGNTQQAHVAQVLVDSANKIHQQIVDLEDKEQRISVTLDSIGDAVIVTDKYGYITRMNNTACQLTDWTEQEAIGQKLPVVFDIYNVNNNEQLVNPVEQVLATKHMVELDNHTVLVSKKGKKLHISDSAAPIRYPNDPLNTIHGVILVFQNVTTQYKLKEQLRNNAEFLNKILEVSPSVIYVLDISSSPSTSFTLSYVSRSIQTYTGDNVDTWLAHADKWAQRIHPDDVEQVHHSILKAISTKKHVVNEFRLRHHDGYYIHVRDALTAVYDEQGQPVQLVGVASDVSAEKINIQRQHFLGEILDRSLNEIIVFDADSFEFTQANKGALKNLGYTLDELKKLTSFDIKPEFTQAEFKALVEPLKNGQKDRIEIETLHKRKDGTTYPVTMNIQFDHYSDQAVFVSIVDDITDRKHSEQALEVSGQVFESVKEGILVTDSSNTIIQVNPAFCAITGYSVEDVIGKKPNILNSGHENPEFYSHLWESLNKEGAWSGEIHNQRKNGEIYPQALSISTVLDKTGNVQKYIAIMADTSEEKKAQQHIEFLAQHDLLTHLPNRAVLNDRIHQAIVTAERQHQTIALLFLDIDRFKFVNDSLGHALGDKLLIKIATILKQNIRKEDTISRTGGDEFTILLVNTSAEGAAYVAQNLVDQIAQPFSIDTHQLFVTLSIGISLYPQNGDSEQVLSQKADTAMYRSKQNGRNQYQFFTEEMHSQMLAKIELEKELRFALQREQFELVYQPQVDLAFDSIVGCESLIRWKHPEKGYISPAEFIPIAEESGLINSIGDWVLETAIKQIHQWNEMGYRQLLVAVNLSGIQFNDNELVSRIKQLLYKYDVSAENLELEITESIAMKDIEFTISQLQNLAGLGIQLSLDDFGTGYSSLSYLKQFPLNKLKIDQSFVFTMIEDEDNEAIVDAVITLAQSLRLKTIAEGVETKAQYEALKKKGCNEIQGYYFSKPISDELFTKLLLSQVGESIKS